MSNVEFFLCAIWAVLCLRFGFEAAVRPDAYSDFPVAVYLLSGLAMAAVYFVSSAVLSMIFLSWGAGA